jgi:hypothetical protein
MMVVSVVALSQQLEPGNPVPQVETFGHSHLFQQPHRTVNRRQIAVTSR